GRDFVPIRIMNNIIFFLSIIALYLLVKDWFNKNVALISSLFYGIFMSAPIYEGQLALTSSLSAPIIVFSFFFCGMYIKNNSKKYLFIASFLLSVATLIKVIDALGFLLLLGGISINHFHNRLESHHVRKLLDDLATAIIGLSILPIFFFTYFGLAGILGNVVDVFISQTLIGYQSLSDVPFGITFYTVAQGLPLWIFAIFGLLVSLRKNKFRPFLIGWLAFAAVIAAFPPHFGHRFIYVIAPASVLAAVGITITLDNLGNGLKKKKKNLNGRFVMALFMVTLLALSLPIAFVFQLGQYPQYHITSQLFNFSWGYADSSSYSTQTTLGQFLRLNGTPDSSILIHAWSAEIYYFAGKLPPSKYVWTRPDGIKIPESEYNRLIEGVKSHEYEFIVFFDHSLAALRYRMGDSIVNQTFSKYFYYGNIDNAFIFSRHNSVGQSIYCNFITQFPSALKLFFMDNGTIQDTDDYFKNEPILVPEISALSINGDIRDVIFHHPPSAGNSCIGYNILIPENSSLKFAIGIDPAMWVKTDGTEFIIKIKYGNNTQSIWNYYLDPRNVSIDRKWQDFEIDLHAYHDKEVTVFFLTRPGPENVNGFDWAYWATPVILVRK
ncbi:MAG: glycosyltransferase family 39 protein, partial [Candidatus Hodarchaeota archaeon]